MDGWTSCYDALPEMWDCPYFQYSKDVLAYVDYDEYYIGYFKYYEDGRLFFIPNMGDDGWQVHHEIFWCDLPSPPKIKD